MHASKIYLFFNIFINYDKFIKRLVKGHLVRTEIEFDKLAAPFSPISFPLYLNNLRKK
jgi:hypothetical protein